MFSSLQQHVNKLYGGGNHTLDALPLTDEQRQQMTCLHSDRLHSADRSVCGHPATHFANTLGVETLLCDEHAPRYVARHQHRDDATSFCRLLSQPVEGDCKWFIAWKLPLPQSLEFGSLPWLWYPTPIPLEEGLGLFNIYSEPDLSVELPPGACWRPITKQETAHLLGQLIYECQRGKQTFIIGFASLAPHDQPDPSLGYSIVVTRNNVVVEPYCFNYRKVAAHSDIQATWQRASVIEYNPAQGVIRSIIT